MYGYYFVLVMLNYACSVVLSKVNTGIFEAYDNNLLVILFHKPGRRNSFIDCPRIRSALIRFEKSSVLLARFFPSNKKH